MISLLLNFDLLFPGYFPIPGLLGKVFESAAVEK